MGSRAPAPPPTWLAPIVQAIKPMLPADFVGEIRVNCFKGGMTTVSVQQTFRGGDLAASKPVGER